MTFGYQILMRSSPEIKCLCQIQENTSGHYGDMKEGQSQKQPTAFGLSCLQCMGSMLDLNVFIPTS